MNKYLIPGFFTLLNLTAGLFSTIFLLKGNICLAVWMFILAGFCDSIDGRIARRLNATSDLGKEFDSLSDMISFGIFPALMINTTIHNSGGHFSIFEFIIPAIFVICGALRLSRYNVLNIKDHFLGMPIPVAAGLLLLIILVSKNLFVIIIASLILSGLMVSNFKFPRIFV